MTEVKVCGLTRAEDAEVAIRAGAGMVGFIFVPGTPRALEPHDAAWVREIEGAATVGVFRNAELDVVLRLRDDLDLDWVQLHGDEPDEFLDRLGSAVLRRVPTAGGVDWRRVSWLAQRCLPLIDPGAGDGCTCEWSELVSHGKDLSFGFAGGLDPDNVSRAIRIVCPVLVDVSSGVEKAPGIKDHGKILAFLDAVRTADATRGT